MTERFLTAPLRLKSAIPLGMAFCRLSKNPLRAFPTNFLQSAARTPCSPTANNSHTYSLRCIFCQVHAPTENDLILFVGLRRQTLRGFFDKLKSAIPLGMAFCIKKDPEGPGKMD